MTSTRLTLAACVLAPLLVACQSTSQPASVSAPATRLQGALALDNGQWIFTPCQESRRFVVTDSSGADLDDLAKTLAADTLGGLFADLGGKLGSSTRTGVDGSLNVSHVYRVQAEGPGCDDPNFKQMTVRATGNEPFWSVQVLRKGLILSRPGQDDWVLPYLEESLPGQGLSFSSEANGQRVELWVAPQACTDNMSGAYNHLSAQLRLDGQVLRGCASYGGARN